MRVRILLMTVAALILAGFAPAPFPRPDRQRADPADLTGTWVFTASEMNGQPQPLEAHREYKVEISKNRIVFTTNGSRSDLELKLDPTASPPSFTWSWRRGPGVEY